VGISARRPLGAWWFSIIVSSVRQPASKSLPTPSSPPHRLWRPYEPRDLLSPAIRQSIPPLASIDPSSPFFLPQLKRLPSHIGRTWSVNRRVPRLPSIQKQPLVYPIDRLRHQRNSASGSGAVRATPLRNSNKEATR